MKTLYKTSLLFVLLATLFAGCEWLNPETGEIPFDDKEQSIQIAQFLEENTDSLSTMSELLRLTEYQGLLNTYGASTVFAPTDNAFNEYLKDLGKASISDLTEEELKNLIEFHIVVNEVNIQATPTGLLNRSDTTINGLRHFIDVSQGFDNIVVNKSAGIISTNELANGRVYILNQVLESHADNIYDYLNESGRYSIFTAAIESVGLKEEFQKTEFYYNSILFGEIKYEYSYTLFAETDEIFKANQINSLDELKSVVHGKSTVSGQTPDEALKDFIDYHILFYSGRRFTFQWFLKENIQTRSINNSKNIEISESNILRPDPILNETSGTGIKLNYRYSDVVFKNGVIHELEGVLFIVDETPTSNLKVECEKFVFYYSGFDYDILAGEFKNGDINIESFDEYSSYIVGEIGQAIRFTPSDIGGWIEFIIPNVSPGTYDITLDYRQAKTLASESVNIYFRNSDSLFDWKTQLVVKDFNMAEVEELVPNSNPAEYYNVYPDYSQNRLITTREITTYGDYVIRFAHVDLKAGYYDAIKLTVK